MPAKILIGIITAHHASRRPYRMRARENFLKNCPLPYVYVYGRPSTPPDDALPRESLMVNCDDSKEFMVLKNQALFKFALDSGYDYCFRACDDTWLFPERIQSAGLEPFDYAGQMPCKFSLGGTFKVWMKFYDYMHGGCGIWLSRKAMEKLVADKWTGPTISDLPSELDVGFGLNVEMSNIDWDDRWIGETLKGHLALDDPLRNEPIEAYARQGIGIFEDSLLFFDDDPQRPLAIHDPGVLKFQGTQFQKIKDQIAALNRGLLPDQWPTVGLAGNQEDR